VRRLIFPRGNAAFAEEVRASLPRLLQEKGLSKHVPRLFRVCIVSIALGCFEPLRLEQAAAALDDPGLVLTSATYGGRHLEDCDATSRIRCGAAAHLPDAVSARSSAAIPWSQLGNKAGADYKGDGLAVVHTAEGARLRCAFQRLEAEVTREGLWLASTVSNAPSHRFRVLAADVRRLTSTRSSKPETRNEVQSFLTSAATDQSALPCTGTVEVTDKLVRLIRTRRNEKYTAMMKNEEQEHRILKAPLNTSR